MQIIKRAVIEDFSKRHPDARRPLEHWYRLTRSGNWQNTTDTKVVFGVSVDFLAQNRVVFDIQGNDYRLIAEINYRTHALYIRFLDTHVEYDKVDAATVKVY
jgi:mRNA interferase HigB